MIFSVALAATLFAGLGRVLTGNDMSTHNTFDDPDAVSHKPYSDGKIGDGVLTATLPPMSVTMLQFQ